MWTNQDELKKPGQVLVLNKMVIGFLPCYESYDEYLCSGSQLCRYQRFAIVNMKTSINVLRILGGGV